MEMDKQYDVDRFTCTANFTVNEILLGYIVTLKAKLKLTIPREFRDYWWLFLMLHVSHYGARLGKER